MYNPLSQKPNITVFWPLMGGTVLGAFGDAVPGL